MRETLLERSVRHRVPTLHHGATRLLELRRTRLRCSPAAASRLHDLLETRLVVRGLATERGTVDAIPNRSARLSANGALGRVRGYSNGPKMRSELPAPAPERRLADIQPLALLANSLDHQVDMRVILVGVQHHRIAVLECEFLPGKLAARCQELPWRRARRHRQHDVVNELRRLATGGAPVG